MIHTLAGCLSNRMRCGLKANRISPGRLPIANVIAFIWNGGTLPDAAVISAKSDHIRMAVKPISVPRIFTMPPSA